MRVSLLGLLPLISAIRLHHIPTPQDTFAAANALLHSAQDSAATTLGYANDITLAMVPGDEHVVLTSAHHPNHRVRIKRHHDWCDPSVGSYTGYLDVGDGKDLFFYFFESRSKPKEDPVIMWINGGPGCSSALGTFMELGPCSIKDDPKSWNDTAVNPHSWNNNANLFLLDEPINVGFSYAEHGQTVDTTEKAAVDIASFVQIFFDTFKEFEGREFHMAGESYGGRYLPVFASAVYDGNAELEAKGKTPINLKSVMIGNGVTDELRLAESYYKYQCTINGGLNETVQPIKNCVAMAEAVPKCHHLFTRDCLKSHDYTACSLASLYCEETLGSSFIWAEKNPYDVTKHCSREELTSSLCYSVTDKITDYLNLPDVRAKFGINKNVGDFSSCSQAVGLGFGLMLDNTGMTWLYVSNLLERGIRVLSYVGTFDFICNHIGNEMWLEALEWNGKEGYNKAELADWKVDGKFAGKFKSFGNLSHLKVWEAGHMVPYDKPAEASAMLNSWLNVESF